MISGQKYVPNIDKSLWTLDHNTHHHHSGNLSTRSWSVSMEIYFSSTIRALVRSGLGSSESVHPKNSPRRLFELSHSNLGKPSRSSDLTLNAQWSCSLFEPLAPMKGNLRVTVYFYLQSCASSFAATVWESETIILEWEENKYV